LDAVVKTNLPSPCRDSNPDYPARSPALYHERSVELVTYKYYYYEEN